jgi:hypothetical protein
MFCLRTISFWARILHIWRINVLKNILQIIYARYSTLKLPWIKHNRICFDATFQTFNPCARLRCPLSNLVGWKDPTIFCCCKNFKELSPKPYREIYAFSGQDSNMYGECSSLKSYLSKMSSEFLCAPNLGTTSSNYAFPIPVWSFVCSCHNLVGLPPTFVLVQDIYICCSNFLSKTFLIKKQVGWLSVLVVVQHFRSKRIWEMFISKTLLEKSKGRAKDQNLWVFFASKPSWRNTPN